jgi:hypothetical protein
LAFFFLAAAPALVSPADPDPGTPPATAVETSATAATSPRPVNAYLRFMVPSLEKRLEL